MALLKNRLTHIGLELFSKQLKSLKVNHVEIKQVNKCYSTCLGGNKPYDPNEKINYEITKDPNEWKFVTRLLPQEYIPNPPKKESYPSGWTPQKDSAFSEPYFVRRTKNHMIPVYLDISQRGMKKVTSINRIEGDISLLAQDLRKYLEGKVDKPLGLQVDEVTCKIKVRGDYVCYVLQFFADKGF